MSVTVQGHPCIAFKDSSSYYSVLARGYARSNGLGDWRNTCLTLSVDIRLHNFAFTLHMDFILVNDLPNCDAVFGLQFSNLCRSSECDWLYDLLPITNLPPEVIQPLPPLLLSSGRPAIVQSAMSLNSPLVSFSAVDSLTPGLTESIGVSVSHKTTKNMVGPDLSGDAGEFKLVVSIYSMPRTII
ncbi:hypothetical protein F5876DRAFT_77546 [Lentinula aff. lateritia]|uniref:Uncharacterized protein n=1 Tax=Lentinula aff. lateritia TaxID=2804960 RepID=A0ACC1TZ08_9AGAR|nr:hypothetical protein F5876DRAFT_77546 [Lentinula aff. lateritia]